MTRQDRQRRLNEAETRLAQKLDLVDEIQNEINMLEEEIVDLEHQLDLPAEMTKGRILAWAELHREECIPVAFAQTILNCWLNCRDDEDFENLDEEFFIGLRDAMNEQFRASQQ
jgi:hypothetical protein